MLLRIFVWLSTSSALVSVNTPTISELAGRLRSEELYCGANNFDNGPWIVNINTCQKMLDLPKLAWKSVLYLKHLLLWVPSRLFQCSASCFIPYILPCWADLLPHSVHWPIFHCSACSFRKVQLSNLWICNMVHGSSLIGYHASHPVAY